MKKITLLTIFALFAVAASALDFAIGPFQYEVITEATATTPGTAKCIGLSESGKASEGFGSNIRSEVYYNGRCYYVEEIASNAFKGVTNMSFVQIGYGIKTIGFAAFANCTNLYSVNIPSSVVPSGNAVFRGCTSLRKVFIAATTPVDFLSLTFPANSDMTLYVANGVADVNDFKNHASYANFTNFERSYYAYDMADEYGGFYVVTKQPQLGEGELTLIGFEAPDGEDTKTYAPTENSYTIHGNELKIAHIASYAFDNTPLETVNLANWTHLKTIGNIAFLDNDLITSITLNEGLETIGASAFANSSTLKSINIPKSVKKIGELGACTVFDGCFNLATLTVDADNAYYSSVDNMLFSKDHSVLWRCPEGWKSQPWVMPGKVTLPDETREIAEAAFARCENIVDVRIPYNVECLYNQTFTYCPELEIVRLPSSLTYSIGAGSFTNCTKLKTITMAALHPAELINDDDPIFNGCGEITLYVTRANDNAVAEYTAAEGYNVFAKIEQSGEANDYQSDQGHQYVVTTPYNEETDVKGQLTLVGFIPTYYTDYNLRTYFDESSPNPATLYDAKKYYLYAIAKDACKGLTTLKNAVIPNTVTSIGASAFEGSSVSGSVSIPKTVKSVGEKAFYNCANLKELYFEYHGVNSLKYYADLFESCNIYGNNASDFNCYVERIRYRICELRINSNTYWPITAEERADRLSHLSSLVYSDNETDVVVFYHPVDLENSDLMTANVVTGYDQKNKCVTLENVDYIAKNEPVLITEFEAGKAYRMKNTAARVVEDGNLLEYFSSEGTPIYEGRTYKYSPSERGFNLLTEETTIGCVLVMDKTTYPSFLPIDGSASVYGDVNGDGSVDVDDVNAIIDLILNLTNTYRDSADINGDGSVDVDDLNIVIEEMLK